MLHEYNEGDDQGQTQSEAEDNGLFFEQIEKEIGHTPTKVEKETDDTPTKSAKKSRGPKRLLGLENIQVTVESDSGFALTAFRIRVARNGLA
jgi:hypothetical protein